MTLRRQARATATLAALVLGAALTAPLQARQDTGLAPRIASYSIDATLDAAARALTGRETITWRNPGAVPGEHDRSGNGVFGNGNLNKPQFSSFCAKIAEILGILNLQKWCGGP